MKNNKLKTTLLALGLGMGISSSAIAVWTPTPEQCQQFEAQCEEKGPDSRVCNLYHNYCLN